MHEFYTGNLSATNGSQQQLSDGEGLLGMRLGLENRKDELAAYALQNRGNLHVTASAASMLFTET